MLSLIILVYSLWMINLTNTNDNLEIIVVAITNIKSTYGIEKNWQGDPCAPKDYVWEGLNCSTDDPPRITSL